MSDARTLHETIAAISTPPGRGGIGIVRLSGPEARGIAEKLVRLSRPLEPGRTQLADVMDDWRPVGGDEAVRGQGASGKNEQDKAELEQPERIDEAVVTWFKAPHSYTGEDVVEIAAHGSPVVLELLLKRAISLGARLAEAGEFTERAFLAGRLDLTQAEAVRDLIEAQTLTQARQAASQMGGSLSRRVGPVKQGLVELIALLEAGIDFAEDDVEVTPAEEIARRIGEIRPPLAAMEASFRRGRVIHDGLTLAIVGRPNVGKSSLFNRLVERERAIVTAAPGTTRDTVTERIALDGIPLELVDTAGLREGIEEAEQLGIVRSREALADADLVLVVVDATERLNDEEQRLLDALEGRPAVVAVNKCDLAEVEWIARQGGGDSGCADFSADGRRDCGVEREDFSSGDGRSRGRIRDVDKPAAPPGSDDRSGSFGRGALASCSGYSARDDPDRPLSRAVGARFADRADDNGRRVEPDLLDLLHWKMTNILGILIIFD